ncbi:MAG: L-seryl-tRNA(Sec) selenium transferase [Candidatus Loosdrechtia sp.]|uniref:L-seryl-tRNA(Sec) selenium transferase n=1 Tax=Candidatus Loosdrechtia sp. TaxID=3101272 RepID=UPI003A69FFB8|nr:MAG: L-seryl-tRNA(Sec) selenium transferase [Candidatus Jettenia sp. AMX2]
MHQDIFRRIPSVSKLLGSPEISHLLDIYPRQPVIDAIREVLDNIRQSLVNKTEARDITKLQPLDLTPQKLSQVIQQSLQQKLYGIEYAINATGIILHTGLGRAPLASEAAKQLESVLRGYCTLEIERFTGRRGSRYHSIEKLICMITGAESALVVNNNAAAVLLTLDTIAKGREVIISRSQLVEIGGSFRMPDVMSKSGAILVEVGTTNKTYLSDYSNAITERTGLILKVHQSNFKIIGFTESVDLKDLVSLGRMHNIPVAYDLGSGLLIDLQRFGLPYEPTVQEAIQSGADIVTFSTDKLLGGPQGGIIAGKKKWIDLLRKNPLTRALRVGKLTIAALEATLRLYLDEDVALKEIPTLKIILTPLEVVEERGKRLINTIHQEVKTYLSLSLLDGVSELGGGTFPGEVIPSKLVSLRSERMHAEELASHLRKNTPPVFSRIEKDCVLLDMRTVQDAEIITIARSLEKIYLLL